MADLNRIWEPASAFVLERNIMRAVFMRKESEVRAEEFQVVKVINLPIEKYAEFSQHLCRYYDFIEENKELMQNKDGVRHCILVTGEGVDEGILVESEGAPYARYSSFVPSVREIIRQYEAMNSQKVNEESPMETGMEMKM